MHDHSNWQPAKNKPHGTIAIVFDLFFACAYIAAFAAGIKMIEVAKDAKKNGHPQNPDVVGLLFAVKICKTPKVLYEFYHERSGYNAMLSLGIFTADVIWAIALYYALQ